MSKKILFFIVLFYSSSFVNFALSEIIPLKKPKKTESKIVKEKKIIQVEKKAKLSFKIPKKKPL